MSKQPEAPELKVGDVVQLVALELGYRNNAMVHPGTKFSYTVLAGKDGKPRLPKWAQLASLPIPPKPKVEDLKPKATQAAVAEKRKQIGDSLA